MKRVLFVLGCLFFCFLFSASAQSYKWVKGGGTTSATSGTAGSPNEGSLYTCTDPNGNVYSLNIVSSGSVHADTFNRSNYCASGGHDILVTSYNCSGQMRWAKLIGSYDNSEAYGIIADSLGHVYVAAFLYHGHGSQTVYIGYDTSYSANPYISVGLIQLDTAGHFNWIRLIGQNSFASLTATMVGTGIITLDKQQNPHLIKTIKSGLALTSSITSLYGTYDFAYSPLGNLISVKRLALDSTLLVNHVAVDTSNNKLYVTGSYNISFGYLTHTFVAAYDTARNLLWADTLIDGTGNSLFTGIATDNTGHLYFAGTGQGTVSYMGDTVSGTSLSFVVKADTLGNPLWMRRYIGTSNCFINGFTLMPGNKMAAVGDILGQIASDGDTIISFATEANNIFFTVLDTAGNVHALEQLHANAFYDYGDCIASDRVGNLYMGGEVGDSVWQGGVGYRSRGGNTDFFVMKYGVDCSCTSMPIAAYSDTGTLTYGFTYSGPTSGIDSIRWDFGDGTTSTATNPTHTYSAAGTFHACVRIYSYCGNDIHCTDIFIPCVAAPTASFTSSGSATSRSFAYTGTTTLDSVVWNFGDGGHGTGLTASHTYIATGSYTACVTAYNHCGTHTVCSTIVVPCLIAPVASLTTSGGTSAYSFNYTGTTVALDSVVWRFGDGSSATGTTASHTYSSIGAFTVCVIAYTPCGWDSACATVTVPCITAPAPSFTYSGTTSIHFTYTGTTTALDSISWDFGDGTHGTGTSPIHTYSAVGTFTVCAIAYNPCGSSSVCHAVTIPCIAAPVANLTGTGTSPINLSYAGTTTGLDSIVWYLGDGTHLTGFALTHNYASPGTYTVCVYAYNPCGWDSACNTFFIPCETPIAAFAHFGDYFTYTGTSAGIDSVVWHYGDGTQRNCGSSPHYYATSGIYHVCVIAYTNCAVDSTCSDIYITGTLVTAPNLANIEVFPNPATDKLTVSGIVEATNYKLLSVAGVTLQQGLLQKGNNSVDLKGYLPGVYVLEMTGGYGVRYTARVVKE